MEGELVAPAREHFSCGLSIGNVIEHLEILYDDAICLHMAGWISRRLGARARGFAGAGRGSSEKK